MGSIIGLLFLAREIAVVESIPWKCIKHMIPEMKQTLIRQTLRLRYFTCGSCPVGSGKTVNKNGFSTIDDVIDELQHWLQEC